MQTKEVKTRLRELRNRSRLSLEEVSVLTGYDVSTISKHESGSRNLTADAISRYAKLYKVETHELFDLEQLIEKE